MRKAYTIEQKGDGTMKRDVVINIYDHDGDLVEKVHREMDVQELTDLMLDCLKNEGIPVVKCPKEMGKLVDDSKLNEDWPKAPFRPYKPFEWAGGFLPPTAQPILMKLEMKVDQQTLACEGFGMDVLKAQERFLHAILPEFDGE